ncbi:protein of unknown function (plasmid) [Streptantibioticus cattleyicolor NRRL 8057 = DSM 46488]|nr:protein of unknown function [Streptantibioticus cattleyicolor NRRL 8057 = DSM 46488]
MWAGVAFVCLAGAVTGCTADSYSHDSAVLDDVLVSDHGRTLTTPVAWADCEDRPRLEAHESAHGITLVLKERQRSALGVNDSCGETHEGLASISLGSPVGDREITDSVTRERIVPFDDTHFPHPRYLPPGFTPAGRAIMVGGTGSPPSRSDKPTWTCSYQRNTGKRGQAGAVSITVTTGETTPTRGTPTTVNGHPARLEKTSRPSWTVVWPQDGYTITVWAADPFVTDAEFLRIARDLGS